MFADMCKANITDRHGVLSRAVRGRLEIARCCIALFRSNLPILMYDSSLVCDIHDADARRSRLPVRGRVGCHGHGDVQGRGMRAFELEGRY